MHRFSNDIIYEYSKTEMNMHTSNGDRCSSSIIFLDWYEMHKLFKGQVVEEKNGGSKVK